MDYGLWSMVYGLHAIKVMIELIDTHCHLDMAPLKDDVEAVLQRAQAAGVRSCVTIGTTVESSRANVALAQRYPQLAAAVGIHPQEADTATEEALAEIERLAASPRVVAIGEVGLDDSRDHGSLERQTEALRGLLAIAARRNLPVLFHCRGSEAYGRLLELLRTSRLPSGRGLIHCASGSPEFICEALALGLYVSFAGNVTFPKAQALRELVPLVPDDRVLIETDAPFLAPQPVRGQPNEPSYVAYTAACVAKLRDVSIEALGELTSRNARRLFGHERLL